MKKQIVIFDLDDTLSDSYHRSKNFDFKNATSEDWNQYHIDSQNDDPIDNNIDLLKFELINDSSYVVILTGRGEVARENTLFWLLRYGIEFNSDMLIMRPEGDYSSNVNFKKSVAEGLGFENIKYVIDDNPAVIDMFRSNGVSAFLTTESKWKTND